jgi:peptidyl-prolyl cis-trans isomerase B (cyclophilin B)
MTRITLLVAAACLLAACGSSSEATTTTAATDSITTSTGETEATVVPSNNEEFRSQPTACGAEQPPPPQELSFAEPGDAAVTAPITVVITTSCGEIEAELDPALAAETVNSFVFLAESGYFDGTVWHRVFPGFIVQGGDPTGTGGGGPGYTISDEFPAAGFTYARGTLAMANAGPGTTGSQFFIMLADGALPPQYSVFGSVVSGEETLDAISAVPLGTAAGSLDPVPTTPLQTVYIESASVER